MEDQDRLRIKGEKRILLLKQLQKDHTTLKLNLLGEEYERLTIIIGIQAKSKDPRFIIDYPAGFKEAVNDVGVWEMRFEFLGTEKLPYTFRTSGGEIFQDKIWINFPQIIERIQRREYYRLEAPMGTKIHIQQGLVKHFLSVLNVSEGGALISLKKRLQREKNLDIGEHLRRLGLEFPSKEDELRVPIREAFVIRSEKDPLIERLRYGLQFTQIERKNQNVLKDLIYRFQRELLRKRKFLSN